MKKTIKTLNLTYSIDRFEELLDAKKCEEKASEVILSWEDFVWGQVCGK